MLEMLRSSKIQRFFRLKRNQNLLISKDKRPEMMICDGLKYGFKFQEYLNLTTNAPNQKRDSEKTQDGLLFPVLQCL